MYARIWIQVLLLAVVAGVTLHLLLESLNRADSLDPWDTLLSGAAFAFVAMGSAGVALGLLFGVFRLLRRWR